MLKSWSKLLSLEFSDLKNISNDHNMSLSVRRKAEKSDGANGSGASSGAYASYGYAYDEAEVKPIDTLLQRVDHLCYYSSSMLGFCQSGLLEPCELTRLPEYALTAMFDHQPSSQLVGFMLHRTVAAIHSSHMGYMLQLAAHSLRPKVTRKFLPVLFHLSWSRQFSIALRKDVTVAKSKAESSALGNKDTLVSKKGLIFVMCDTLFSTLARRVRQLPLLAALAKGGEEVVRATISVTSMLSLATSRLIGLMVDAKLQLLPSTTEQLWQVGQIASGSIFETGS